MKLSNVIKCPVCHEMAGLRYNENRVYQSRCQNMACRETVTVTAPSGKAAEELFSKFEKGTIQTKLSIPKRIAVEIQLFLEEYDIEDQALFLVKEYHRAFGTFFSYDFRKWANNPLANNRSAKIIAYLNPLTRPFVEVEG